MPALNQCIRLLGSVLLNPKSQKPTLDQRFSHLLLEFQNFYNELTNSHQPWTYNEVTVSLSSGTQDYLVPRDVGKILFAYANTTQNPYGPYGLEIVDLASVTFDFFLNSPLDLGFSPDFNERITVPFPNQVSFFRNAAGSLYMRLAPFSGSIDSVTIVYATGDWTTGIDPTAIPIFGQYHSVPVLRTAISLLPGCEWPDGVDRGESLSKTLLLQENRHTQQFGLAKRTMTGDNQATYREPFGGDW